MYEVDFTGWVRTPEELEKIKYNWKYRLYLNYKRFFISKATLNNIIFEIEKLSICYKLFITYYFSG